MHFWFVPGKMSTRLMASLAAAADMSGTTRSEDEYFPCNEMGEL